MNITAEYLPGIPIISAADQARVEAIEAQSRWLSDGLNEDKRAAFAIRLKRYGELVHDIWMVKHAEYLLNL